VLGLRTVDLVDRQQTRRNTLINNTPAIRLLLAATLLGGIGLLTACGHDPAPQTTTTERTSTVTTPQPATSVTTTQTQQSIP